MNEKDILAWLRDRVAAEGTKGLALSICTDGSPFSASLPRSPVTTWMRDYGFGNSIAEALADLAKTHSTPEIRAERLRAEAAAIEAEASK